MKILPEIEKTCKKTIISVSQEGAFSRARSLILVVISVRILLRGEGMGLL
jgi:hypothetical protein